MDTAVSDEGKRGGKGAYGEIKGRVGIIGNGFPDNLEGLAHEKLNKVQNLLSSKKSKPLWVKSL